MSKFKFTTLNTDYTLHKSIVFAKDVNDAYSLWVEQFGHIPFIGVLNIKTL